MTKINLYCTLFYNLLYLDTPRAEENMEDPQDKINNAISLLDEPIKRAFRPCLVPGLYKIYTDKIIKRKADGVASRKTSMTPIWAK